MTYRTVKTEAPAPAIDYDDDSVDWELLETETVAGRLVDSDIEELYRDLELEENKLTKRPLRGPKEA